MSVFHFKIAHPKRDVFLIMPSAGSINTRCHPIYMGAEFIPKLHRFTHRINNVQNGILTVKMEKTLKGLTSLFILAIQQVNPEPDFTINSFSRQVPQGNNSLHFLFTDIRIKLNIFNKDGRACLKLNLPGDAIPVALGMIGYAMGIRSDINLVEPVVNPDRYIMFSGMGKSCQVKLMRGGKAVLGPHIVLIKPDIALPMNSFKKQGNSFPGPTSGNGHFFPVPCGTFVIQVRRQPEREFQRCRIKRTVVNGSCPVCL